jgi:predicted adenine nucleotide alpha hydrolase (AANH) superfamily ATPase
MRKILLHGCCADCSLKFIESVKNDKEPAEIEIYYYNPNIHPRSEYQSRLKAMQEVIEKAGIRLIIPDWKPVDYFEVIDNSEKGIRCVNCWNLRIKKTAEYAKENGYDCFSTTLISSQYQDSNKVIEIGQLWAKKLGIEFVVPKYICTDLETSGFYKQFFCGCVYSLRERLEEKYKLATKS